MKLLPLLWLPVIAFCLVGAGIVETPPNKPTDFSQQCVRLQDNTVTIQGESGYGTGVVFRRNNGQVYIWTAAHVVGEAKAVIVSKLGANESRRTDITADVLFNDAEADIAILQPRDQTFFKSGITFPKVNYLPNLGESIIHVGSFNGPVGAESVSVGIISYVGRQRNNGQSFDQISAAAMPGSSGGGVFRADNGQLVGLVNRQVNINFTLIIPSRKLLDFAAQHKHLEWVVK